MFVVTLIGMTNGTLTEPVGALYAGKRDGLVRWAVALTGSFDLANDLVQDAFVALQANRHEVREPDAYVKQVIINGARKAMRYNYRQPVSVPVPEATEATLFDADLWTAVQALDGVPRLAIVLRYFDGLSIAEIAGHLGKSESSTKSILHRALRNLRKELS